MVCCITNPSKFSNFYFDEMDLSTILLKSEYIMVVKTDFVL
jgi:hypothetical protein